MGMGRLVRVALVAPAVALVAACASEADPDDVHVADRGTAQATKDQAMKDRRWRRRRC
jgi:hypothetical protein